MKQVDPYYRSPAWEALRKAALKAAHWRCADCGQGVRGQAAGQSRPIVDHIVPRRKGGSDAMHNLRVLCLPCHNRKTHWEDRNTHEQTGADGFPVGKGWS